MAGNGAPLIVFTTEEPVVDSTHVNEETHVNNDTFMDDGLDDTQYNQEQAFKALELFLCIKE